MALLQQDSTTLIQLSLPSVRVKRQLNKNSERFTRHVQSRLTLVSSQEQWSTLIGHSDLRLNPITSVHSDAALPDQVLFQLVYYPIAKGTRSSRTLCQSSPPSCVSLPYWFVLICTSHT
ncbi:hypothetical protein C8R48DRAFT_732939, partial [Suillus tomentosus]